MIHPKNNRQNFYKYMTREVAEIVLRNRTLRWSTSAVLNDPFEMQFDLSLDYDWEDIKRVCIARMIEDIQSDEPRPNASRLGRMHHVFREELRRIPVSEFFRNMAEATDEGIRRLLAGVPELREDLRRQLSTAKILSLTELPDHPAMWAHYAESYRGIVLRFRSGPGLDSPWPAARPVQYVDRVPPLIDRETLIDLTAGRTSLEAAPIIERMIFTKNSHWAYEREWRIASGDGRNRDAAFEDIPFNVNELDAVIIGPHMAEEHRQVFIGLVSNNYPHAEILEACVRSGAFTLEIRSLQPAT